MLVYEAVSLVQPHLHTLAHQALDVFVPARRRKKEKKKKKKKKIRLYKESTEADAPH